MTNEEIKELLRDLAAKAEADGQVKSKTVRINFSQPEPQPEEVSEKADRDDTAEDDGDNPASSGKVREKKERDKKEHDKKERAGTATVKTEASDVSDISDVSDAGTPEDEAQERGAKKGLLSFFRRKRSEKNEDPEEAEADDMPQKADDMPQKADDTLQKAEDTPQKEDAAETAAAPAGEEESLHILPPDADAPDATRVYAPARDAAEGDEGGGAKKTADGRKPQKGAGSRKAEKSAGSRKAEKGAGSRKAEKSTDGREPDEDAEPSRKQRSSKGQKSGAGRNVQRRGAVPAVSKDGREQADFESDAYLFRSSAEERRKDQEQIERARQKREAILQGLAEHGIGRIQLTVIGICLLLALIIGIIAWQVVEHNRKIRNVTADEGLQVVVEKEPRKWCSHGSVTLTVREESPIQTILVNEEVVPFTGSSKATVSFDCDSRKASLMVISEEKVLNATVEFSYIDAVKPVVNVSVADGLVTLDAQDTDSGVADIYYGPLVGFNQVPQYVRYTEPFPAEQDVLYSYFAVDRAGNATEPVPTNLTSATGMTLSAENISLFPAQTYTLSVTPEPANAFINSLTMLNSNEKVISLDKDGTITALSDGEADVTVSAEGIKALTCHVTVRSQASITLTAVGDITLGEDVSFSPTNNFTAVHARYGDSYFFENVRDIFKADDITFGNLEGTLTDQGTRQDKLYAFRGDPSYVNILKDGSIEAVTLANNHSSDYGEISLTDTEKYLDEAGIDYVIGDKTVLKEVNGIKVGLAGIYVLADGMARQEQTETVIASLKEEGADIVVVAFHWGNEKESKPDSTQTALAHAAIDAGADLVVGHHPHVLQGIEKYSGKYIVYSLGNFCFGGNSNPSDMDTMIFQQTFEIERGGKVQAGDVRVIPCSVSSDSTWNNYQPTPAMGDEYQRIMDRINELCEPFKTSF